MKKMKHFYMILTAALIVCSISCKGEAEYPDVLLITGTEDNNTVSLALDGPTSMGITVTATDLVSADTRVTLKVNPELVAELNRRTGRSYTAPPEGSYQLANNAVTIHAGQYVSDQTELFITSVDDFEEGANYCIPVSITGTDGTMPVLEASRTIFVTIRKILITQAVNLRKNTYFTVPSFIDNPDVAEMTQLTMECRVLANTFHGSNPYISSIIGIEEKFLLRFGDISIDRDQLQLAGGEVTVGITKSKYQLAAPDKFAAGRWYHVACVYTGFVMNLYIDGRLAATTDATQGYIDMSWDYAGGFHIGYSADGRMLDGYISEARVWNKALTASQLQDNLCAVDPTAEGLVAYWRFDSAEGRDVLDLTGHGHTAVANRDITWITGVRCP
ncbi:MAG: DUF1735 and LamG domain-containing protein [Prevotellaceae bacterium]|nr:DUF1735 and LamG domain-containing protein [Prevotellaceae bacterium]